MAFRLHPTLESERANFVKQTALGLPFEAGDSKELPLYINSTGHVVADQREGWKYTSPELEAEPAGDGRFYLKHVGPSRTETYFSCLNKRLLLSTAKITPWSLRNGRLLAKGDPEQTLCRYFNEGGRYGVGIPSPLTHLALEERRAIIQQSKERLSSADVEKIEKLKKFDERALKKYNQLRNWAWYRLWDKVKPLRTPEQNLHPLLYPDVYPLYFPRATNPELYAAFGVDEEEREVHPDDQPDPDQLIHLVLSASPAAQAHEEELDPPWKQAPANIDLLAVSTLDNGLLLGVGTDLSLYTRTSVASVWIKVPNSGLVTGATQLRDGTIVGVGTDGTLWARATLKNSWAQVPNSGTVVAITQLHDETIVGVGTDGALWTRATLGSDWAQVPNSGIMISVHGLADGTILGIGPDNRMYSRATLDDEWTPVPDDREALAVTDLPSGMLVAVGPDHKLYYTPRR